MCLYYFATVFFFLNDIYYITVNLILLSVSSVWYIHALSSSAVEEFHMIFHVCCLVPYHILLYQFNYFIYFLNNILTEFVNLLLKFWRIHSQRIRLIKTAETEN